MKYLAVLITVYNRKATTLSCLKRLYEQNIPVNIRMHVYMTNDSCTDGTPEAVREQFPQVNIIDGDGTLFWNRGMWTAWNVASHTNPETLKPIESMTPSETTYSWYLWLNDDTELMSGAITELTTASENCYQGPNIIVGATKASDSEILTYGGRIKKNIPPCDGILQKIDYFNGNIVLVNKQAFDKVGNLDFYFTHSRGDYDYGLRAKKVGVIMLQCGKVLGVCDKHEKIDKWCDPNVPFIQRWKLMHKPNGMPPNEIFHLEKRQFGIFVATIHWLTVHLRCIYPKYWINS